MRRIIGASLLIVGLIASSAQAQTITRDGSDYDGYIEAGCTVFVEDGTELHVNCKTSDTPARIRYRFLRDVGATFDPADVRVVFERHGGDCSGSNVRWMVPVPRTVRVIVNPGCYTHIVSVRWRQR